MTAKKKDTPLAGDQQSDMDKIEAKVKKMLDPSEPDSTDDAPENDVKDERPGTAPELDKKDAEIKLPTEIKIVSDEEEHLVNVLNKPVEKPTEGSQVLANTEDSTETSVHNKAAEESPATDDQSSDPLEYKYDEEAEPLNQDNMQSDNRAENGEVQGSALEESITDEATEKAVDDIVASESDELLKAEDEKRAKISEPPKKATLLAKIKRLPSAWWHSRRAQKITLALIVLGLALGMTVPTSRYFMLNTAGIRSEASIQILDDSTQQPLKNVSVKLRGQSVMTDSEGIAKFSSLKLGRTELVVEKRAFAALRKTITLGWGSNPLGDVTLNPVGSQYTFRVIDFLSGQPLNKIEAVSGEASAFSDEKGLIKLTIDKTDDSPVEVSLAGEDLRAENLSIDANDMSEHVVEMVPARKHVFISKRSGKYDVYKIDIDGQNEEVVVGGSGHEKNDMVLVPHPENEFAALVSTRTGARNSQGFLLSTLLLIDLSDNSTVEVALSERVQVLGWIDNKLVYVRIVAGSSAANPNRHRLMTYDLETFDTQELASSNYFNDVLIAKNRVYYAPSSAYQTEPAALFSVKADSTDRKKVIDKEAWSLFRTGYDSLALSVGQDWYGLNIDSGQAMKLGGEPANLRDRPYVDSPDGKNSLWIDIRDGKGVLLLHGNASNQDTQVLVLSGLKTPIRWLNDSSVVYRVVTAQETADYALSINGGEPKKIRDVTDTAGVDDWYYY